MHIFILTDFGLYPGLYPFIFIGELILERKIAFLTSELLMTNQVSDSENSLKLLVYENWLVLESSMLDTLVIRIIICSIVVIFRIQLDSNKRFRELMII